MSDFWLDAATNTLIYPGPPAPQLVTTIPELRVNGRYFAVPRTLRTSQVLRWLNYPVPPIMDGYDFPHAPDIEKPLPHQKVYANFQALHPKCFNLGDPGCVDADTEYLSPTGWRRIADYDGGLVGQYHADGTCEFVKPASYVVRPCKRMYRFLTTRGVDQKLSPEHRVVYLNEKDTLSITTAEYVAQRQASTKYGWSGRFITSFHFSGPGISLKDAELRVMVAVIADGFFASKNTSRCRVRLKKDRKKIRLRKLLQAAGIVFSETCPTDISSTDVVEFRFFAPRREREYGDYYWACSNEQLRIIADECVYWDGSFAKAGSISFASASKASADFIQFAFSATNRTAAVSADSNELGSWFRVYAQPKASYKHLCGNSNGKKTEPVTVEDTLDGKKYCFEVPTSMLVLRRNGHVFITGNTMKTLSTLWAADFLMQQFPSGQMRALIFCPLTIVETVWGKAIFKNLLGRRTFQILIGNGDKRMKLLDKPADFYILNYDGIKVGTHFKKRAKPNEPRIVLDGFGQALARRTDINLIICDEARKLSDPGTDRYKVTEMIVKNKPYIWELTGTPLSGGPLDAYGMAKLINNAFGKSFTGFRLETMMNVSTHVWKPQRDGYDKARRLLTPAVRFDICEIWDGPKMTFQRRKVELTDEQKKQMHALKHNLQIMVSNGQLIDATSEAVARTKFIQISLGAIYDGDHKAHALDAAPRYREIEELIESTDRKVVICVPITSVVHILVDYLKARWKKKGFKWTTDFMNGEVTAKERPKLVQRFEQDENFKAIVVDPGVIAHGINEFVVANTIIWAGATDKAEDWIQANKRIERPGQKYPSTCYQIVSNKLEEQIFDRLETNTSMQGLMLQAVRNGAF